MALSKLVFSLKVSISGEDAWCESLNHTDELVNL